MSQVPNVQKSYLVSMKFSKLILFFIRNTKYSKITMS